MDIVFCGNPSNSSSWVWVGEYFLWYRPTRVVLDIGLLNGCVCIIIIIKGIYIAEVRKGHKCAMSAEMAVWLRNSMSL